MKIELVICLFTLPIKNVNVVIVGERLHELNSSFSFPIVYVKSTN